MTIKKCKVLIIGSGPAGYTAAIYAARAALKPVLVEGYEPGGQLTVTTDVENWPGFEDVIQGPWLMEQMQKQAKKVGTELAVDYINEVDFSKRPFTCIGDSGTTYKTDAVIVATGAQAKWLGLESETKFRGYGVSGCATCDGFFYKNKDVAVVGGGNTAVEEALYLTTHAKKVTLIHRKDKLRCEKILEEKLLKHPKIKVIWDTVLEEVVGDEKPKSVTGLKLKNVKTDKATDLDVDGVFIAIGHKPQTDIFKGQLDMDKEGYLKAKPGTTQTNVAGVFAAGDVQDKIYRQAVTAAGQGCMAALDVVHFLES
ncbi:thioredoxin-disulfide reductase [Alphaproteobacteria bacterium]|nr:thioredoxin-disulfide reductase [Alphaproteobacteria bacterium]